MFELLNNTIANQKVPVPSDKQQVDFDQERTDWYTIKPKKSLVLKMDNNKAVEFRRDDMPVTISTGAPGAATMKKAFSEDVSTTSNSKLG